MEFESGESAIPKAFPKYDGRLAVCASGYLCDYEHVRVDGGPHVNGPWLIENSPFANIGFTVIGQLPNFGNSYFYVELLNSQKRRDLHRVFSNIAKSKNKMQFEKNVVKFANKYGPLTSLTVAIARCDGETFEINLDADQRYGEAIEVWRYWTGRFEFALRLWEHVRRPNGAALQNEFHIDKNRDVVVNHGGQMIRLGTLQKGELASTSDRAQLLRRYVFEVISTALIGQIDSFLDPASPDDPLKYQPTSLLGAVAMQFALEVSGAPRISEQCAHCSVSFRPRKSNQKYCSANCRSGAHYSKRLSVEARARIAAEIPL